MMVHQRRRFRSARRARAFEMLEQRWLMDAASMNWQNLSTPITSGLPLTSDTLLVQFAAGSEPGGPHALSPQCYAFRPTMKSGVWQIQVPQ